MVQAGDGVAVQAVTGHAGCCGSGWPGQRGLLLLPGLALPWAAHETALGRRLLGEVGLTQVTPRIEVGLDQVQGLREAGLHSREEEVGSLHHPLAGQAGLGRGALLVFMLGDVLQGLRGLPSVQLRGDGLLLLGGGGRRDLLLAALFFLRGRGCRGPAGQALPWPSEEAALWRPSLSSSPSSKYMGGLLSLDSLRKPPVSSFLVIVEFQ